MNKLNVQTKEELFNGFNFNKVAEVMEAFEWKWYMEGGYKVPTAKEIRNMASELYDKLISEDITEISSGGIVVKYDSEVEEKDVIRLEFIFESNLVYIGENE